ncbi:MAG TPA: efflux RND transporter periplasmic adaptor subunit [Kofleriaceae bacterium]
MTTPENTHRRASDEKSDQHAQVQHQHEKHESGPHKKKHRRGRRGGKRHKKHDDKQGQGSDQDKTKQHKPPSHRAKIALFVILIGAAVLAIGFALVLHFRHSHADKKEHGKRVDELALGPEIPVAIVQKAPPTRQVTLPGDVRALKLAVVYARVSGYLEELEVDRGDPVKAGQVLGKVVTPETGMQLASLEANLNTKSAIANRLRPLVTKGVVAQQDLDRADADVQQARSDVDRLRQLQGFDLIRAPFDGVVTKRYVDVGALMPAPTGSTQSAQPLVDVADISRVRIVVYVGQRDATGINVGDKLTVVRDDDPAHPIEGSVTRIPKDLDLQTRTMWVECELPNPDGRLYPGLFVTVTIDVPAATGVVIPSDAISLIGGKAMVAKIEQNKIAFVPVIVADDDGKVARIVGGLKVGEQIATRISDELTDGAVARPITPEQLKQRQEQEKQEKREKGGSGSSAGSGPGSGSGSGSANLPGTGPTTPAGSTNNGDSATSSAPAKGPPNAANGGSLGVGTGSGSGSGKQ